MAMSSEKLAAAMNIGSFLIRHPTEARYVAEWRRIRKASPLDLRQPWWSRKALDYVADTVRGAAQVFEYGSGGSTLWLLDLGCKVVSVEHDELWFQEVARTGAGASVLLRPPSARGLIASDAAEGFFDTYVSAICDQSNRSLDLVIVDGRARVECVRAALPKIKSGGMLLLDDSDRPRYSEAFQLVGSPGRQFRGLKPHEITVCETTIWEIP
jgi:hypothetical protein